MTRSEIYALIDAERARQDEKHPVFATSEHQALCVLTSEVGEVAAEVRGHLGFTNADAMRDELIQVAAVCVRWLESGR